MGGGGQGAQEVGDKGDGRGAPRGEQTPGGRWCWPPQRGTTDSADQRNIKADGSQGGLFS